jgi:hypothetical protein
VNSFTVADSSLLQMKDADLPIRADNYQGHGVRTGSLCRPGDSTSYSFFSVNSIRGSHPVHKMGG